MNKLAKTIIVFGIVGLGWYILLTSNEPAEAIKAKPYKPDTTTIKKLDSLKKVVK